MGIMLSSAARRQLSHGGERCRQTAPALADRGAHTGRARQPERKSAGSRVDPTIVVAAHVAVDPTIVVAAHVAEEREAPQIRKP